MNPEPSVEVDFHTKTGKVSKTRFANLRSDERGEQERVAAKRVEQITQQLNRPHGLTNKERQRLHKERVALQIFLPKAAIDKGKEAKQLKKVKAAEKKLRWLARKADSSNAR